MFPEQFPAGGLIPLTRDRVEGITLLGGTILGTTNRGNPLRFPVKQADGTTIEVDRTDELVRAFALHDIDALISIGGDGSLAIANALAKKGLRVVGVPKTIDNDLDKTVITFGFDTAASFATELIDRLHLMAEKAHRRIMVVEVMGRYAGWIALNSGIAGNADAILIPEIPYDLQKVAEHLRRGGGGAEARHRRRGGRGQAERGHDLHPRSARSGRDGAARRSGRARDDGLEELTGREVRTVVLGHLLRGGSPSSFDRLLALRFGAAAVRALESGQSGVMVASRRRP